MPLAKVSNTRVKSSGVPSASVSVETHDPYKFDSIDEKEVANSAEMVESSRFQLFGLLAGGGLLLGVLSIIGLFKLNQISDEDDINNDMKQKS